MKRSFTHMTLFVLYVVLTFESEDEIQTVHSPLFFRKIIEIERFLLRGLAIIPDARPLGTFENQEDAVYLNDLTKKQGTVNSLDKILWCDHSNEFFSAVLSHNTICFVCKSYIK